MHIKVMIPSMPVAADLRPYLERIDRLRWYSNGGPLVTELESRLGELMGGVPTVCIANGTQALEAVLHALKREMRLPRPLRVLVPAVTFLASARAIMNAGCVPVICDVCPTTWMLTPAIASDLMRRGVQFDVVMPVAAFGQAVDVRAWSDFISGPNYCRVLIDSAAGLPDQQASRDDLVTVVTSLHATKFIGAGEGGAIASADPEMLAAVRSAINFGLQPAPQNWGTNAKLSEYHAAIGLASLAPSHMTRKAEQARNLMTAYRLMLPPGCTLQTGAEKRGNHTLMPVLLPKLAADVGNALALRGIETRRWYAPMLQQRTEFRQFVLGTLPIADMLDQYLLGLPFHGFMDAEEVGQVCSALQEVLSG